MQEMLRIKRLFRERAERMLTARHDISGIEPDEAM